MYADSMNSMTENGTKGTSVLASFGNTMVANEVSGENYHNVIYPNGYSNADSNNVIKLTFKVLFLNGFTPSNANDYLTLNSDNTNTTRIPIVSYQNGTLNYVPIHEITTGNFSCVQPGTILELYYTDNWDNDNNPAFIIVGNPVVLSSSTYTIYADGQIGEGNIGDVKAGLYSTVPYGWLKCDDTSYSKSNYPKLWDVLPSTVKNISDNTFKIDLREATLKGTGVTSKSTIHYSTNGLSLGEFISDRYPSHSHPMPHNHDMKHTHPMSTWYAAPNMGGYVGGGIVASGGTPTNTGGASRDNTGDPSNANTSSSGSGSTTEVKAVGVNWIIKAM